MKVPRGKQFVAMAALVAITVFSGWVGCSRDDEALRGGIVGPDAEGSSIAAKGAGGRLVANQTGATPPAELVTLSQNGQTLRFWPYTGGALDGTPSDPVNLVFVGNADPVRIRAALLALDGDRSAFGLPPVAPFDATWSDAIGDVQACYAEGEGWQGSAIQLALGSYAPARVHLRLFRTGVPFGENGTWTLGAAHFEVLIPGTADHQVLSWERAEQIVAIDLIRSGLVEPAGGAMPTAAINAAPAFRSIPAVIYNGLPTDIRAFIEGPLGDVAEDVPLGNDGSAMLLHLSGVAPILADARSEALTLHYQQVIPKPFCSDGPLDYVLVSGPVDLSRTTTVDAEGRYSYEATIHGRLSVTPIDVTANPPAPSGETYFAEVGDVQSGEADAFGTQAMAHTRRIAPHAGGSEMLGTMLRVSSRGSDAYRAWALCP